MNKQSGFIGILIVIGIMVLVVLPILLTAWYVHGTQQTRTITVKDKERIVDGESSKYLVYAEEGVFENTDSVFRWKFESSDVYSSLEPGKRYECDTYGWRIQFFSKYPNIVGCEETK